MDLSRHANELLKVLKMPGELTAAVEFVGQLDNPKP
jgi:hypothetical protein